MKITGELLKAERLKRDLTVQDIAYALKLSQKIIQSIESGDIQSLPAKTFVRGFVKSYADYLKIDTDSVLKQFQEEMGSTHPVPKTPPPLVSSPDKKPTPATESKPAPRRSTEENIGTGMYQSGINKKNVFTFVLVAALVACIGLINKFVSKYQKELVQTEDQKAVTNPLPAINPPATTQNPNDILNASVPPESATTSEDSATASGATNATEPASQTAPANVQETATYPTPEPSKGQPVEILIEAKKEVLIEYAKGNTTTFSKINLKPNSFQILRSNSGLHIRTQDGSAVLLTVNGVSKGPASSSAKPVQLSY